MDDRGEEVENDRRARTAEAPGDGDQAPAPTNSGDRRGVERGAVSPRGAHRRQNEAAECAVRVRVANPLGGVVKMHQKPIVRGLRGTRDEQHHNEPHAPLRRLSTAGGVILDAPRAREKLLAGGGHHDDGTSLVACSPWPFKVPNEVNAQECWRQESSRPKGLSVSVRHGIPRILMVSALRAPYRTERDRSRRVGLLLVVAVLGNQTQLGRR